MLKPLFFLLFLIPSLSLGLTFKDGKQVEDEPKTLIIEDNKNFTKLSKDEYLSLSFKEKTDYLGIKLSGYYIDETLKNRIGKYILPSNKWFRKYINADVNVFYKKGSGYGDWDGDGRLDYLGHGIGHRCGTGGSEGSFEVDEGRRGCLQSNAIGFPVLPFKIDTRFNFIKYKSDFDFKGTDKNGYGAGHTKIMIEDFNKDGLPDFFIPDASVQLHKGKFTYVSPNITFISQGKYKWVKSDHSGFLTDKKKKMYLGFSHGVDTGDIDNDGDVDVITTDFAGIICHFNDGAGNFKAKVCHNKGGFVVSAGDFNNDGYLDVVSGNAHYNAEYRKYSPQKNLRETKNSHYIALFYGNGKGKFKRAHILESPKQGNFVFSEAPEMLAFDFDNDGDLDLISSHVGMYYAGSAWVAYENINGELKLSDINMVLEPLEEWQDAKVWGSMVKDEYTHPWNTYCGSSNLIDVNSDGFMDAMCVAASQDKRSDNLFLINRGNMQFDLMKPEEVTKWVTWLEDAIVEEEEIQGPDGEDILKDLEIIIQ